MGFIEQIYRTFHVESMNLSCNRVGLRGGLAHEREDIAGEVLRLDALADKGLLNAMETAPLVYELHYRRLNFFAPFAR